MPRAAPGGEQRTEARLAGEGLDTLEVDVAPAQLETQPYNRRFEAVTAYSEGVIPPRPAR